VKTIHAACWSVALEIFRGVYKNRHKVFPFFYDYYYFWSLLIGRIAGIKRWKA
jgi:hypothetical protein